MCDSPYSHVRYRLSSCALPLGAATLTPRNHQFTLPLPPPISLPHIRPSGLPFASTLSSQGGHSVLASLTLATTILKGPGRPLFHTDKKRGRIVFPSRELVETAACELAFLQTM